MTSQEKINAVKSWQQSDMHPLTCVNCSHRLQPTTNCFGEVVLLCGHCGEIQTHVPKIVYQRYENIKANKKEELNVST